MQTFHLDARTIDPRQEPAAFLADFYHLEPGNLFEIRKFLYASEEIRITEVFHWPVKTPNWKAIADALENIQQHSPTFYVIWGPETENAILYEETKLGRTSQQIKDGSVAALNICTDGNGTLEQAEIEICPVSPSKETEDESDSRSGI